MLALLLTGPARADFVLVENFDSLVVGDIDGQGSWMAHTSFEVAEDLTSQPNQVLNVLDNGSTTFDAFNDDPALTIGEGSTATVFFRVFFNDTAPHANFGMSDDPTPGGTFSDFEAQLRIVDPADASFDARDGSSFGALNGGAGLALGEWYLIWIVIDNQTDSWECYVQNEDGTGQFPTQTQLSVPDGTIGFRNGVASSDLVTFFLRNSSFHQQDWQLDDLHIDTGGENLARPIPPTVPTDPPVPNGVTAVLEDVLQVPGSAGSPPLARINVLREVPDGSGRLFVNDLRGPLHAIDGETVQLYMDLSVEFPNMKTSPGLASGFVSFAFHPDFATNGLFYTVHSEFVGAIAPNLGTQSPPFPSSIIQHAVLTEWDATDPSANLFGGTSRELMRIESPHRFHNLQEIAFNPTAQPGDPDYGLLYLGSGDFGNVTTGEPEQLQRLDTPYGAILRIDPLGGPFVRGGITYGYGIPPTNPYANDGDPATLDEIYAHGLRNSHRFIWDTADGTLFGAEIGQDNIEEINVLAPGRNYGWPLREGTFALDPLAPGTVFPLPPDDPTFGFTYPVAQYDHNEGRAIAGGVIVRGAFQSELEGMLVFGDIVTGKMYYADAQEMKGNDDGDPATLAPFYELTLLHGGQETTLLQIVRDAAGNQGIGRADLRFATNLAGAIYVTTKQDGYIRKLTPLPRCSDGADNDGDGDADFPADISCPSAAWSLEVTQCSDGIDNDGDMNIDWDGGGVGPPDPQCVNAPWKNLEAVPLQLPRCGLGPELALLLPMLLAWRSRRRASSPPRESVGASSPAPSRRTGSARSWPS